MTATYLDDFADNVGLPDEDAAAATRQRCPDLGRLTELAAWLAGAQGVSPPTPPARTRLIVFAGDHRRGSQVSSLSQQLPEPISDATARRVVAVPGAEIEADARETALAAIELGRSVADEEVDAGAGLLLLADVGRGATTSAAIIIGLLTSTDVATVTGRGAGIDDATWMHKATLVRDAMRLARPLLADPVGLLAATDSYVAAALVGFLLESAARRTPVVLDGVLTAAAALVAQRLAYRGPLWWQAGHLTGEPAHSPALERLDLRPILDLGINRGGGIGALLAAEVIVAAATACN
jgi:nicotinate-nucleotide--dimethylbenzimidazole phosphoribosyltransferase